MPSAEATVQKVTVRMSLSGAPTATTWSGRTFQPGVIEVCYWLRGRASVDLSGPIVKKGGDLGSARLSAYLPVPHADTPVWVSEIVTAHAPDWWS